LKERASCRHAKRACAGAPKTENLRRNQNKTGPTCANSERRIVEARKRGAKIDIYAAVRLGPRWLNRFAWFTAIATLLLICSGGMVTSKGVGLGRPTGRRLCS